MHGCLDRPELTAGVVHEKSSRPYSAALFEHVLDLALVHHVGLYSERAYSRRSISSGDGFRRRSPPRTPFQASSVYR